MKVAQNVDRHLLETSSGFTTDNDMKTVEMTKNRGTYAWVETEITNTHSRNVV